MKKRSSNLKIAVLLASLSSLFIFGFPRITRDSGINTLMPENHPDFVFLNEMEDLFGATDQVVIGVRTPESIYSQKNLQLLITITNLLKDNPHIQEEDVLSLATVDNILGIDGFLEVGPLMEEEIPLTEVEVERIQKEVRENPLYQGKLVSADEKSFVVLASIDFDLTLDGDIMDSIGDYVYREMDKISNHNPEVKISISGTPILKYVISDYMDRDMSRLFPLAILLVMILLYVFLRSVTGIIVPILVTLFAILWTFGLKGFLGSPLTIAESSIPIMLIAIGCADGVHIVSEFLNYRRQGMTKEQAVNKTLEVLRLPVILTSITTALGFASLITAPGISIKNMGLFLTFGVLVAMVFSLYLIPALLRVFPNRDPQNIANHPTNPKMDLWAEKAIRLIIAKRVFILSGVGVFLVLSIIGVSQIQVEADELNYFKDHVPLKQDSLNLQEDVGGVTSLDIIIESDEADTIKDPKVLKLMEDIQEYCDEREEVGYTLSLVDYIKLIHYQVYDQDSRFYRIPDEVEMVEGESIEGKLQIANLLFLYEMGGGDVLDNFVDTDYQTARITARIKDASSIEMVDGIRALIKDRLPKGVTVRFTNQYTRIVLSEMIVQSQINSYVSSIATILVLLMILFRSPKAGLLTAIPVFAAVSFNFAIMWIFGISLNIGTSIIASVGMGVGIDYAIHYFSRFRIIYKENGNYTESLVHAFRETYKAITFNALAVGTGFLVLLFSDYLIIAHMGWIISLSMFTTAMGALIILPALLATFPVKLKLSQKEKSGV